ncbi:hypothetical protein R69658_07031 [Paraburkholderia aspalathi]|uniref:Uncharacterized protein n=1 Tax=Paraburkholderia aspalathi TaxID=1324617 RepID=A0ABM8T0R3_9BURK|nr:hypothetical protein R69658_07031 [Paraburkholderia aspalathi]
MQGQADRLDLFPFDHQRFDPLGDERHGDDVPAIGRHLHTIPRDHAHFLRQIFADLHELLRLHNRVQTRVLGPVVEMLGQTIRGGRMREILMRAEGGPIVREHARRRTADDRLVIRMQRVIAERRFKRFVVLGEWPFHQTVAREEARHALRIHDERIHAVFRRLIHLEVGNVGTAPRLAVPRDQLARGVERFAAGVAGSAVVQNPPVRRPRPCPVQRIAYAGRVRVVATAHLVARLSPRTAENPATARSTAVVAKLREARQLLAFLREHLGFVGSVGHIGEGLAVELHGDFFRRRAFRIGVRPAHVENRIGILAAVLLISPTNAQPQPRHDLEVALRFARAVSALPVPLQHAAGTDQRAAFLGETRGGQTEHFRLNRRRIHVVELAEVLPELRSFSSERIHDDKPLQLGQTRADLRLVRRRGERVEALRDVAGHLALIHQLEDLQHVV